MSDTPAPVVVSVQQHPRARAAIRRTRAWAGIAGFVVVLGLSLRAGLPGVDAVLRALVGGVVAHFGAWICAVALWRRLVVAEIEVARRRMLEEADAT